MRNKMSQYQDNDIETLLEQLESLQITNRVSERITEYTDNISTAPVLIQENNEQVWVSKNMVPDPGWFNGDRMKFEDWWKGMRLFLKSNRIIETDNRITAILEQSLPVLEGV